MPEYIIRLRRLVERNTPRLLALPDASTTGRPAPGKWSAREVMGHLVDSASNNHQRFVRALFQDSLTFAGYDQDAWVSAQDYQGAPWAGIVTLWRAFNLHIAHVMESVPEPIRLSPRSQHNLDTIAWKTVPADQPVTLDYFMRDYVDHLQHHLGQILGAGAALLDSDDIAPGA